MDGDKPKKNIESVVVMAAFCLMLCGFWCWLFGVCFWTDTTSKKALKDMELHLTDIENSDVRLPPEDILPGDCRILYPYMAANDNQYTLTVNETIENNQQTSLFVDFPDGSRIEAYFYEASLEWCWVIDEEGERQVDFPWE